MFLRRRDREEESDEELVARITSGDKSGLGSLWDRYAQLLFGVAMKYLKDVEASKDAVMDLFTRLPQLLAAHPVDRFRPWIHVVMRNHCLGMLRKRVPQSDVTDLTTPDGTGPEADAVILESELEHLERAIESLNAPQATCIRLFHFERLSYQEVAARLGATIDEVRSHLQNGRRNLRTSLIRHAHQRE